MSGTGLGIGLSVPGIGIGSATLIFSPTPLDGAFAIDAERFGDQRGYFARTFCEKEFAEQGLATRFVQANTSFSANIGTVRGMHFQRSPHQETKLVRCVQGSVWDVIVDYREGSPTYLQHFGAELSAENGRQLYVPKGFAHGFQTLTTDAVVAYMIDEFYTPAAEHGLRFDDPAIGIEWPREVTTMSDKDRAWPLLG